MPKILLTTGFVADPPVVTKGRVDYFDTEIPGFMLEVRSSGRCTYYLRYRDRHGRLRQVRIGPVDAISLENARMAAREIRSQTALGYDPAAMMEKKKQEMTFGDFAEDKYIPHVKLYKRSWEQDEKVIDRVLLPLWEYAKLSAITRDDVRDFQTSYVAMGYKPGSVNRMMALVKYIFSLAERWEYIDKSPARGVSKLADNEHKERFLTHEETGRLLKALKNSQSTVVPDLIEFLILTGARKGEASHAKWEDMDFEHGLWTVPMSKSGKPRHIPLSGSAINVLKRRVDNNSPFIFANPKTGEPLKHFHSTWDRIRKEAGLEDVRVHDLRHNFASLLINHGRSLYEVQKLLGHADISTTQRYAHLSQDTLKEATEIVSRSIGSDGDSE
ncbi:site-specific recombinase XerD [Desulfobotulus alkaliphilus]|uniref:Site-specific recombinase XerD n=1 Tax=Desulfobotulus alkaliphilus TaxID=622671 RepID=A0A562R3B0_9BACT|nr:site-specific integrase [Desulfobotulus alkaliphilus]TWI62260.1 site-specific recombinase XerD [Desulfobotulus alkaliphilus]TWI62846.1 site-specific recombinase XerD [Desulfobotulus alkaliphilus]